MLKHLLAVSLILGLSACQDSEIPAPPQHPNADKAKAAPAEAPMPPAPEAAPAAEAPMPPAPEAAPAEAPMPPAPEAAPAEAPMPPAPDAVEKVSENAQSAASDATAAVGDAVAAGKAAVAGAADVVNTEAAGAAK